MNRSEAREAAEVMFAYADGKEIEWSHKDENGCWSRWVKIDNPNFDWIDNDYHIKSEPKYRPFKNAEECWQEMQKHTPFGWIQDKDNSSFKQYILSVDREGVMISDYDDGTVLLKYESLLGFCTFVDGTLFGIKE